MRNAILLAIAVSVVARAADGRVYYVENPDDVRNSLADQHSRDLDLSFSAGDPTENEGNITPIKKVYTVVAPEKPSYIELGREADRPTSYYRVIEPAVRRGDSDDVVFVPERNRKVMKVNGNNKGEVILELRVIANHDSA